MRLAFNALLFVAVCAVAAGAGWLAGVVLVKVWQW